MRQLETLAREAQSFPQAAPAMVEQPVRWHGRGAALSTDEAEVARVMQICNACRYCEGFAPSSRP